MVRLTEIFRQAAESAIVRSAHGVNRGELPDLRDNKQRLLLPPPQGAGPGGGDHRGAGARPGCPSNMGIPPEQIQVLSPTRKRDGGHRRR